MNQPTMFNALIGRSAFVFLTLLAPLGCDQEAAAPAKAQVSRVQPVDGQAVGAPSTKANPGRNALFEPAPATPQINALEEGEMAVSINFLPRVGDRAFACGQVYAGVSPGQTTVKPVDFRFFVHDLRLINDQGQDVSVSLDNRAPWQGQSVALLDFENDQGDCQFGGDASTNAVVTGSVPEGTYKGLRFRLGVPTPVNHQDPAQLGAPLEAGGMSWNWLKGFKFLNVEVQSVTASAEQEATTGKFHLGSTACSNNDLTQDIECSKPNRGEVFLPNYRLGQDSVIADLGALFAQSDLSTNQVCHSGQDACAPMFAQVGVDWATGAPAAEQSMFSSTAQVSAPAPVMGGAGLAFVGLGLLGALAAGRRSRSLGAL